MTDAASRRLDGMFEPCRALSAGAFRHVLAGVDVNDGAAVYRAIASAGQSYAGNSRAIERAIDEIKRYRPAP